MTQIIEALLPVFLLIMLGYFFKRIAFPSQDFWPMADKFTYYVLMPSLLIYKLSTAKIDDINGLNFVLSGVITLVVLSLVLVVLNKMMLFEGKSFTSIFQGAIRFNTYVFLALVDAILGDTGLILAAFLITFLIPLINLLCITVFSIYAASSKITVQAFVKTIVQNPLIIACVIGGSINYFDLYIPVFIAKTFAILSVTALPLGLLSVGVGLELMHIKEVKSELFVSLFVKLALFPVMIYFIGMAMDINGIALSVLILFGAMPTAPSAYILARELGGNVKLMSSILTVETLVSIGSIAVLLQVVNF